MNKNPPKVITIPANPELSLRHVQQLRRVAAYCRVSTKEEDQANSYEVQKRILYRKDHVEQLLDHGWYLC